MFLVLISIHLKSVARLIYGTSESLMVMECSFSFNSYIDQGRLRAPQNCRDMDLNPHPYSSRSLYSLNDSVVYVDL